MEMFNTLLHLRTVLISRGDFIHGVIVLGGFLPGGDCLGFLSRG